MSMKIGTLLLVDEWPLDTSRTSSIRLLGAAALVLDPAPRNTKEVIIHFQLFFGGRLVEN
jgi:hypothetical protein